MSVRLDKCHSFGQKVKLESALFNSIVYIKNKLVKALDPGESLIYLGCHFDYDMSEKESKKLVNNESLRAYGENRMLVHPPEK